MENAVLDEFDYLYVTVKSGVAEEITAGYETLGWECVENKSHSLYFDERNLTLRRPHLIAYKDERQLMQIYLEDAVNGLGKLGGKPMPKTTAFSVVIGLLLLGIIAFGVTVALMWGGGWFAGGIAIASFGLALFAPYAYIIAKLSEYEKRQRKELAKKYYATIEKVCESGLKLSGGGNE